jgi:hypothetical protein
MFDKERGIIALFPASIRGNPMSRLAAIDQQAFSRGKSVLINN